MRDLLLLLALGDVLGSLGKRNEHRRCQQNLTLDLVRDELDAGDVDAEGLAQPQAGRRHLPLKGLGHENDARADVLVDAVQPTFDDVVLETRSRLLDRNNLVVMLGPMLDVQLQELPEGQVRGRGAIAKCLQVLAGTGVVTLELDHDQPARTVQPQDVGALLRLVEAGELTRNDEEVLSEHLGSLREPLLQVLDL